MNNSNLTQKAINDFKELYFKKYGIELDDQQAQEESVNLLELFKLLLTNTTGTRYNSDKGNSQGTLSGLRVPGLKNKYGATKHTIHKKVHGGQRSPSAIS